MKCLIIDDDDDDRDFFDIALQDCGYEYEFTPAQSGIQALDVLKANSFTPDFIFLDLNMPLLSGKECLQQIREIESFTNTPVIIYSTSSYYKDIEDTQLLGATHFLTKTADIGKLSQILSQLFSNSELPFVLI